MPTPIIYTLTPNPALDLGGIVDKIVPNEKNYIRAETRFAGGNAINVARLLTKLSIPVRAMGYLGGSVGTEIQGLLDDEHVVHDFVKIQGHTRISITVSSLNTHTQTRLSFPGPHIKQKEIELLLKKIHAIPRRSWLVIGGSFPPGFLPSHVNKIIRIAKSRQILIVLDVPGALLTKINLKGLTLIKPNLVEFQELIGKKVTSIAAVSKTARKLTSDVQFVCVSSVKGGALLVSCDSVWFGTPPRIKVRSTVGAGDSMVAGMVAELCQFKPSADTKSIAQLSPQLLQRGLAAAAATLSTPGTQLGSIRDIKLSSS